MTKHEFEEEISQHLNTTTPTRRNNVLGDTEYNMALRDGDLKAALERAYGLIYGAADPRAQARRMKKKNKIKDEIDRLIEGI